ncbi:MAG: hypothetical protein C0600_01320 [Ignavibacteria bacterium]|nr:MAG: hypothetical protein C0600_01320 [Ignavibacteria bacterium]
MTTEDFRAFSHARILILVAALLFPIACSEDDGGTGPGGDSGKIVTGESAQVLQGNLGSEGGTVAVTQSDAALNGLELTVPSGAYSSGIQISVHEAQIESHDFGADFDPVSPLIRVDNGGEFAGIPMTLHIPLPDLQGRFPVAFYYDRPAGTLEAITPVGRGEDYLDVAVRHFSEIVVSATQIELLKQGGGFHTLFDPAVNGWSFVNYGTSPEFDGVCGGMSIGAARFHRDFSTSLAIKTHFDNDEYWFRTPKVWQDDANALRYVTELQHEFVTSSNIWTLDGKSPLDPIWTRSEEDHFWSICYALLVLNQPQFLFLGVKNSDEDGHAIIAYAYEISGNTGTLKVYDPNYPGKEGEITFDLTAKAFRPYTSAVNATALADGDTYAYNEIIFIPLSTLCDAGKLDAIWQKVSDGSIGDNIFPRYEAYAVPVDNEDLPRVKLLDATSGKTTFLPYNKFRVELDMADPTLVTKTIGWVDLPDIKEIEKRDPSGEITLENPGEENLVGIEVDVLPQSGRSHSWAGFQWYKIRMQSLWLEPADTNIAIGQEAELTARNNGTAPPNARFEWDFGDGNTQTVHGDSTVSHPYLEVGSYTVTVSMYDGQSTEALGSAEATVNVTEFLTIAITLQGMSTTPPSTIKATDGADIPSITISNKVGSKEPLVWNENRFSVDYSYTLYDIDFNTRISGRLAADGKSIETLTAITAGSGYGGDYTYNAAMTVVNFPIENLGPSFPVGGGLTGNTAQPKLPNISWRTTTKDTQGNTTVSELESINWNSDQTKLSVYFYR